MRVFKRQIIIIDRLTLSEVNQGKHFVKIYIFSFINLTNNISSHFFFTHGLKILLQKISLNVASERVKFNEFTRHTVAMEREVTRKINLICKWSLRWWQRFSPIYHVLYTVANNKTTNKINKFWECSTFTCRYLYWENLHLYDYTNTNMD